MPKKKDLTFLIKRIRAATGLTQDGIAKEINYSRSHFSTLKTANSEELYDLLEKHFEEDLEAKLHFDEAQTEYGRALKSIEETGMLHALIVEVAKLKAKVYGISEDAAIDELQQNARIASRQLRK